MIDRTKIIVAVPTYDSKIDAGCVNGLLLCLKYYEMPLLFGGMSNIALARNCIAHRFMEQTSYEWLMMIDADTLFNDKDWELLWEGDEEIVIAQYARKQLGEPPVRFGLGFTRVHRSVFERIKNLMTPDGRDEVRRFYHKGQQMIDYFSQGAIGEGRWVGEDQGFFMWAAAVDATMREETRTSLRHVGRFEYGYPNQIPGYEIREPDESGAN